MKSELKQAEFHPSSGQLTVDKYAGWLVKVHDIRMMDDGPSIKPAALSPAQRVGQWKSHFAWDLLNDDPLSSQGPQIDGLCTW